MDTCALQRTPEAEKEVADVFGNKPWSCTEEIAFAVDDVPGSPVTEIEYDSTRRGFCGDTETNWGGTANFCMQRVSSSSPTTWGGILFLFPDKNMQKR